MADEADAESIADEIAGSCLAIRAWTVNRRISRHFDRKLRPHGIQVSQLGLLVAIRRRQPVQPITLSKVVGLEKSTVSRVLSRMEERAWIAISDRKGRGHEVSLAAKGERLLRNVAEDWRAAQSEVRDLLGDPLVEALEAVSPSRPTPDESERSAS